MSDSNKKIDIANVSYIVVSHENRLVLSLRHTEDITRILLGAIRHSIAVFDTLQRGIASAR
jgi:hypothetical protein